MNETARPAPLRASRWLVRVAACVLLIAMAVACAFVLQYSTHLDWAERWPTDVVVAPVDVAVIAVVIVALWAVLGRLGWALAVVTGATMLLAGLNRTKIELRREPIYPGDRGFVSQTNSYFSMVDAETVRDIVLPVVVSTVVVLLVARWVARRHPGPRLRRSDGALNARWLGVRVVLMACSIGLLVHASHFNEPRNAWRALYDVNAEWQSWSQWHNYRANGFVGGFLYNMPVAPMATPDGYGPEAMDDLAERYAARADQINAERTGSLTDVNVVFVLSESFTDPSWLDGVTLAENPIPGVQQLMAETISGRMYSASYGGGTATMEFESLTGQPIGVFRPQVISPFQMFVADQDGYPSIVGAFNTLGHRTTAVHAYNLHMYKREQVYATFGFDEVVNDAAMQSQHREQTSRYISDAAAFDEVLYHLDRSPEADFVNLVTMQNHGDYENSYRDPIDNDIADAVAAERVAQYSRGLAYTDEALGEFLAALRERDETTIVVFYGDHHPGIYDPDTIMRNEAVSAQTPFFVWNSATNVAQRVEAVTPAMFLPLVYEAVDAPVPPYIALLDDVRRSVPVIQHGVLRDTSGATLDPDALDEPTQRLLDDLRMTQYDFATGSRHGVEAMWPGALGDVPQSEIAGTEPGYRVTPGT